jgi:hypothetical protein
MINYSYLKVVLVTSGKRCRKAARALVIVYISAYATQR